MYSLHIVYSGAYISYCVHIFVPFAEYTKAIACIGPIHNEIIYIYVDMYIEFT